MPETNNPIRSGAAETLLHFAGFRYWSASLLPALVGTTLPFWLHPPGFSFRWLGALEFLLGTVLFHSGFSLLHAWFQNRFPSRWPKSRLLGYAGACLGIACLLGLHIHRGLRLQASVYQNIFIVFGITAFFVGVLYVAPPFSFHRRMGSEIVLAEGLGMLPVLGAYLVQAGDLTRTVYLASLPLVVATGLWIWVEELIRRNEDERAGRRTLVLDFGLHFSARFGVLALALLLLATLLLAVLFASITPLALVILLFGGLAWKIVTGSWTHYLCPEKMLGVRKKAVLLHFATGGLMAASSLMTQLA